MIGFIGTSIKIIINCNSSRPIAKTRSIPYWTTSVFSSTVTDLVLIYESVTSSASAALWLTLHSWELNSLTNGERRARSQGSLSRMNWTNSFTTSGRIEYKSPCLTVPLLCFLCLFVATGTCLPNRCPAMDYSGLLSRKHVLASR
jgi:hypothetical protein